MYLLNVKFLAGKRKINRTGNTHKKSRSIFKEKLPTALNCFYYFDFRSHFFGWGEMGEDGCFMNCVPQAKKLEITVV